jgi:hypothetical protein
VVLIRNWVYAVHSPQGTAHARYQVSTIMSSTVAPDRFLSAGVGNSGNRAHVRSFR